MRLITLVVPIAILAMAGCGGSGNTTEPAGAANSAPAGSKPAADKVREAKVAIVRLNSPDYGTEALTKDIEEGIKQAKTPTNKHVIIEYDAKGDLNAFGGLLEKAAADGADVFVTLLDVTTDMAVQKKLAKPIVFVMANDPLAMGLGKSNTEHAGNVAGVYLPHSLTLTVPIARGSLPKATKMAVLFNPDNKLSVIHKDALLKCDWAAVTAESVQYKPGQNWAELMTQLQSKNISAIILTNGLGAEAKAAIDAALKAKLPVFGTLAKQAELGAIFTREPALRWSGFESGRRVGRIINGDDPAKIPFVGGDHYATVVNTAAAKSINVTILPAIMRDIKDVGGEKFVGGAKQ